MLALWIGLLACGPRRPAAADAPAVSACTLRLATLPNSVWQSGDTTLRFATDTIRYTRGEQSRLYACTPDEDAQALRCSTSPDVLAWCRARLANRRACERALIAPYAARLSDDQIDEAIVAAAEEHAAIAGTEQEGYFTERYARPQEPLLHLLQIQPDPQTCQLTVQETAMALLSGDWSEKPSPPGSFSPSAP